ncbi:hypothetical protein [Aneurinibacillus aneurinilyticus]|uniref:Uncharacterized protein n=1 Tax=Aneurinibacillus aneurinilyticus ATCC 12856 TaxID=649747 RepID=U1X221_ANEAE|nr:hypothetical protein [Aneurinibacillus aneurinilyticus]ERI08583.1 hypothetical protein HMPREF0083_03311 [Aneurinibacillus aneurinilyticus ATCC 12856]MED0706109.1 hypothetical protein [Aneurinibacillus aneurinilyticus]MED0725083.1 hypothetical protein [Aneurinibacillus aneurinilyticus]MED0732683.1 hypothetical protein [Aneurinibacillus aneurinilyticus]MED0739820.1 hypothetical protein [Aneurinibacillus aneurinilyticus]
MDEDQKPNNVNGDESMEHNAVQWDVKNQQLLSEVCRCCPDSHFERRSKELPHIGCCAYEPVFTLFEVYKMIAAEKTEFFLEVLYRNPRNTIHDYEIVAGAFIHPLFYQRDSTSLESPAERYDKLRQSPHTVYKAVDERLAYAVCQFFIDGKGCGLNASFKTSICRSFICGAIEEKLSGDEREWLGKRQRAIRDEAEPFHRKYKTVFHERGWTLPNNIEEIIVYFEQLSRKQAE